MANLFVREYSSDEPADVRQKIDYGSRHTGLFILRVGTVIWLGVLDHRTDIKKRLSDRQTHRRFRRGRLWYSKPRFDNRRLPAGWLPPSLQSRVDNIAAVVHKLHNIEGDTTPIGVLSFEGDIYKFQYCKDWSSGMPIGFYIVPGFDDFDTIYESEKLFWFFAELMTPRNRPDFKARLAKLGIDSYDEWEYLKRSGLRLITDRYELLEPVQWKSLFIPIITSRNKSNRVNHPSPKGPKGRGL